jgi:hypothetical protein
MATVRANIATVATMSSFEGALSGTLAAVNPRATASRLIPYFYAATLFVSALLLFSIQPMFAKMVLPRLGGAPAVWSVAMVFFQTALLAGYCYAHVLGRFLSPRRAALLHLTLIGVTAMTLPISIAAGWGAPPSSGIALWLFGLFAVSIGLPFFTLSASAPLLQSWFAASRHPQAKNPYVLYAASNLGSFAALFAYPVIIEPWFTLSVQTRIWSAGFAILALLAAVAPLFVADTGSATAMRAKPEADFAPGLGERARWVVLAGIPSGLVVAVTAHITTDIAATPFLWVVPLAIYLLTFVAIFRERPWIAHTTVVWLVPFAVAPLAISLIGGDKVYWVTTILLNLTAFALLTLMCHGEVYARRPGAQRLTEFYLFTSLGGVIGGAFAGLLAPQVFNGNYEYPILIAAALMCMPGFFTGGSRKGLTEALPWLAVSAALALVWWFTRLKLPATLELPFQVASAVLAAAMLLQRHRPMRFFALVVLGFVVTAFWRPGLAPIETARSFFGVHKVVETSDGKARLLYHGTTIHGAQRLRNDDGTPADGPPIPATYYYPGGPIAEGIRSARAALGGFDRVAVIGLGTGSLACHRKTSEHWDFFEIDPEVVRIAGDPRFFTFMSACAPDASIMLGDARLTLPESSSQYDLIVLDAFSSDAIPVHLLTREAFRGYLSKLSPHGVIVAHISNRHLDLAPVVANVARASGLVAFLREDHAAGGMSTDLNANARVIVLARSPGDAGAVAESWTRLQPDPSGATWTDDYSNILGAMLRKQLAW